MMRPCEQSWAACVRSLLRGIGIFRLPTRLYLWNKADYEMMNRARWQLLLWAAHNSEFLIQACKLNTTDGTKVKYIWHESATENLIYYTSWNVIVTENAVFSFRTCLRCRGPTATKRKEGELTWEFDRNMLILLHQIPQVFSPQVNLLLDHVTSSSSNHVIAPRTDN